MRFKRMYYFYCFCVMVGTLAFSLYLWYSSDPVNGLVTLQTNYWGERNLEMLVMLSVLPGIILYIVEDIKSIRKKNSGVTA